MDFGYVPEHHGNTYIPGSYGHPGELDARDERPEIRHRNPYRRPSRVYQLFEDADESTSFILARTIENIREGHSDPNLKSDFLS
jgi:hypothetical protein